MAWAFESKDVKYHAVDRVQENKIGLRTHKDIKGHQTLVCLSSDLSIEKKL
jgi:hypothetical protein